MKQHTLSGFEKYGKTTRRAQFLGDMERIIPWPGADGGGPDGVSEDQRERWAAADSS
jgi:hypothetical protein